MKKFSVAQVEQYRSHLLDWFATNQRDFPWRYITDPYAILLAEKVLQQTVARLATVTAFQQLLLAYPQPKMLAVANPVDLEEIFKPIGLLYRSRELPQLAREIVKRHGGHVPDTLTELLALTGVGSYIARAVLSFAFGQDVAVVDTNVSRVLYRVLAIPGPKPSNPARKRILLTISDDLLLPGRSRDYNLAILDLAALICTKRNPRCLQCPILSLCDQGQSNLRDSLRQRFEVQE